MKSVRLCHFPLMSHTISQLLYFLIASCVFLVASFGLSLFDGHLQIFIWASWIEPRDDFCPHHFPRLFIRISIIIFLIAIFLLMNAEHEYL